MLALFVQALDRTPLRGPPTAVATCEELRENGDDLIRIFNDNPYLMMDDKYGEEWLEAQRHARMRILYLISLAQYWDMSMT